MRRLRHYGVESLSRSDNVIVREYLNVGYRNCHGMHWINVRQHSLPVICKDIEINLVQLLIRA